MIGKKIYELRRKKGFTLSELADRANISKSYLSNIERSVHQNPSIQVLTKIAMVLDVELSSLIMTDIKVNSNELEDQCWIDFIRELQLSGIERENIHEYKKLIEFIKWQNQNLIPKE